MSQPAGPLVSHDLYIFRGRRGDLAKILWHDGVGLSLYAKRLDRGKVHLAVGEGGRRFDFGGADGLHAGRDRLAESAADVAAQERGLSATSEGAGKRRKTWNHTHFRAPRIAKTMIRCVAWIPLPKLFPTTSPP